MQYISVVELFANPIFIDESLDDELIGFVDESIGTSISGEKAEVESIFSLLTKEINTDIYPCGSAQSEYYLDDFLSITSSVILYEWRNLFFQETLTPITTFWFSLSDLVSFSLDNVTFEILKVASLYDYILLNSILSFEYIGVSNILEVLLFNDEIYSNGNYRQEVNEKIVFNSFLSIAVPSKFLDVLSFYDFLGWFNFDKLESVLGIQDGIFCFASSLLKDVFMFDDESGSDLLLRLLDKFLLSESVSEFRRVLLEVLSRVVFSDLVDFVRDVLFDVVYLYVNFYMPERWSIVVERAGYRSDTIFCLGDGLYELDFSKASEDTALVLNLAQLSTPKVKRIDKIYYDSKPSEVRIYTDEDVYNLEGEENYVSVPKGIRGKEMKVGLYGMKEVEYVDIGLILEKRSKL